MNTDTEPLSSEFHKQTKRQAKEIAEVPIGLGSLCHRQSNSDSEPVDVVAYEGTIVIDVVVEIKEIFDFSVKGIFDVKNFVNPWRCGESKGFVSLGRNRCVD